MRRISPLLFFFASFSIYSFDTVMENARPLIALSTYAIGSGICLHYMKVSNNIDRFNIKNCNVLNSLKDLHWKNYQEARCCYKQYVKKINDWRIEGRQLLEKINFPKSSFEKQKVEYIEYKILQLDAFLASIHKAQVYHLAKYYRILTVHKHWNWKEIEDYQCRRFIYAFTLAILSFNEFLGFIRG